MKKLIMLMVMLAMIASTAVLATELARDTYHKDHRTTPKLQFEPQWGAPAGLATDGVAEAYIEMEGPRFQLSADPEDLVFLEMKESLLGRHYAYQQHLNGVPVEGGHFIVS
nr:hypothetical protein [Candidatus Krumholzibacteria bacterium]